jgi:predicted nucleic acid-binding Zn ribbon protein
MRIHCSWCGKTIGKERLYLIDSAFSIPKVFCSQKCKWEYEVQTRIESKKLPKIKNN